MKNICGNKVLCSPYLNKTETDFIPCLYLPYERGSQKIFLYFHANAEDLGRAEKFVNCIRHCLRVHVIVVEYPGYGIYPGLPPSADDVIRDADTVFNFLINEMGWRSSDIIVCGRSIGSGPAVYLAS